MSHFLEKRILVTGGAGFIASHLIDNLMQQGAIVHAVDDMSNGKMENISSWIDKDNFTFTEADIRDKEAVRKLLKDVEIVFHQAAKVSVPFSVKNPYLVNDVNIMGTTILLSECVKADVEKFVVASSSSVYGDTPTLPKIETMPLDPLSPYAVSKMTQERMAIAFNSTYGLNTTALRYFNVYGPRQRGGSYAGVLSIFIRNALKNDPLPIEGDGQQTRDFTFIDDVVQCNLLAAMKPSSEGKVYNVGAGSRISIEDVAKEIITITNSTSEIIFGDPRPGDVHDSLASIEAAKKDLGYSPQFTIKTGLEKTIEWYKNE
ncbi:MAG: NAD-dependent epimerase/dehydratase family protein [Candidatus Lokiarchaeota archaeon]|nr:NAD-dependent epimerase/dehydratase family protein [Candidatus Lokiarchaeota archaeon]